VLSQSFKISPCSRLLNRLKTRCSPTKSTVHLSRIQTCLTPLSLRCISKPSQRSLSTVKITRLNQVTRASQAHVSNKSPRQTFIRWLLVKICKYLKWVQPMISWGINRQFLKMLWWSVNMRGHKDKNCLLSIIKICSEKIQIRSYWSQTRKKSKESGMILIRKSNIKTLSFTKITSHLQSIV
jgi:hypothetical protein